MVVVRYSDDGGAWNFSMLSSEDTVYGSNLCTTLTEVAMPNTSTRGRNVTWFLTYDRASTQSQQRCLAFSITTSTYLIQTQVLLLHTCILQQNLEAHEQESSQSLVIRWRQVVWWYYLLVHFFLFSSIACHVYVYVGTTDVAHRCIESRIKLINHDWLILNTCTCI